MAGRRKSSSVLLVCAAVLLLASSVAAKVKKQQQEEEDAFVETEQFEKVIPETAEIIVSPVSDEDDIVYATPKPPKSSYIAETFDDIIAFEKTWVRSQAKKKEVDAEIAKYDGVWAVEEPQNALLKGDRGLVLKSKAKHAAISAPLSRPFKFAANPFVVQYEVTLQEGQECGGAYIKLLSMVDGKGIELQQFTDRFPYTIMFGPDKCGNDFKLHFIFRHVNPINGNIEEKHAKRPSGNMEEVFKDKKPHLYTLVLRTDNTYAISIDNVVVSSGHLLEDLTPPVNPDKEISDPKDSKPADWDEREKIPDPDDKKPEDWDDDAPKKIADESASIPSGWMEDEPEMISDPTAVKPDDWDNDMDGEWEAPLVNNPECADAAGCGPWTRPLVDNPNYKGKWFPKQINNPNYRGQWEPKMISNPDYFEDLEPFKMSPINAVGFELWSMSADILFDNVLICDDEDDARQFAADTHDLKVAKMEKGKGGLFQRFLDYSNERPWLYGIYVLLAAVPVVLLIMCCCASTSSTDEAAQRKKTDKVTDDDPQQEPEEDKQQEGEGVDSKEDARTSQGEEDDDEEEDESNKDGRSSQEDEDEEEDEEGEEEEEDEAEQQENEKVQQEETRPSPRQRRKVRKD